MSGFISLYKEKESKALIVSKCHPVTRASPILRRSYAAVLEFGFRKRRSKLTLRFVMRSWEELGVLQRVFPPPTLPASSYNLMAIILLSCKLGKLDKKG